MNPIKTSPPALREVLLQFSVERDVQDQKLLNSFIERYPQFEAELRSFESQLMLEDEKAEQYAENTSKTIGSHEIEEAGKAVSRFQTRFFERSGYIFGQSPDRVKAVEKRLTTIGKPAYRELATRLGINTVVLNQLRDREIDSQTIPRRFTQRLASELQSTVSAVRLFLSLPPSVSVSASFKAEAKPRSVSKESFEDALRQAGMDDVQIEALLD